MALFNDCLPALPPGLVQNRAAISADVDSGLLGLVVSGAALPRGLCVEISVCSPWGPRGPGGL
jgi:hypothetical protein